MSSAGQDAALEVETSFQFNVLMTRGSDFFQCRISSRRQGFKPVTKLLSEPEPAAKSPASLGFYDQPLGRPLVHDAAIPAGKSGAFSGKLSGNI